MSPTCRIPNCEEQARGRGENIDGFGSKFCSPSCELKFEHLRADAREARREAEERNRDPSLRGGSY